MLYCSGKAKAVRNTGRVLETHFLGNAKKHKKKRVTKHAGGVLHTKTYRGIKQNRLFTKVEKTPQI